jgi:hypothetical protein
MRIRSCLWLVLAACAACDAGTAPVAVLGNAAPSRESCGVSADGELVSAGRVNLDVAQRYWLSPIYRNDGADAVTIEHAHVELVQADGTRVDVGSLPNPYTVVATARIDPYATAVGAIPLIPPAYMEWLPPFLIVELSARGVTANGDRVGAHFVWPIETCDGDCLVACTGDELAATCFPGQDVPCTS